MAYVEQTDIEALIPSDFLTQSLDDDSDGVADSGVWDKVVEAVGDEIDGALGQKYAVPFGEPCPSVVKAAAKVLALWSLYQRRGFAGERNPWEAEAKRLRDKLDRIGRGEDALTPDNLGKMPGGVVIAEDSKTYDANGNLMV